MALELTTGVSLELQDQHNNIYQDAYPRTEAFWLFRKEDLADGTYTLQEIKVGATTVGVATLLIIGGSYYLQIQGSVSIVNKALSPALNFLYRKWIHLAWSVSESGGTITVKLYENGINVQTSTFSGWSSSRGAITDAFLGTKDAMAQPAQLWFSEYVVFNATKTDFEIYRLAQGCNPDQLGAHWMWFLNADNETNVVETELGTWQNQGSGMVAKDEFKPFAVTRASDAVRLAEIEDPLTITYDVVWFLLEKTSAFRSLIPAVNRIKYTRGKTDPERDRYADNDLPEVRLLPELGSPDMHPATNLAKISQGYRLEMNLGDDQIDEHLFPLLWIVLRCIFGWKDVTLSGASFLKVMEVASATPTEGGHMLETGQEGWQGVCVIGAELWFNEAFMAIS